MKAVWLSLAVVLVPGASAMAQNYYGSYDGSNRSYGYGYGYDYYGSRGTTAAESYYRGLGEAVRAAGQYNLATSGAAINREEARKKYIENRKLWTNTYFEMRRANRAYRQSERTPQMSREARVRWAQAGKPEPLSPSELDTINGRIRWPMLLTADQFLDPREQLNKAFAKRAKAGTTTWENYQQIEQASKAMLAKLKGQIRSVSSSQYMAAKQFVDSLLFEAKNAPRKPTVAGA